MIRKWPALLPPLYGSPDQSMAFSEGSERSRLDEAQDKSSIRPASQNRPFTCSTCNNSFVRLDHLKRHIKLHTGGKQYQCHCGEMFSRNDVLAKHLRHCDKASDERAAKTICRTRSKRACDRCAKLKMKCNSQTPCDRCSSKSITCKFSRPGYVDPYKRYGIGNEAKGSENSSFLVTHLIESPTAIPYDASADHTKVSNSDETSNNTRSPDRIQLQSEFSDVDPFAGLQMDNSAPDQQLDIPEFFNLDFLPRDFEFVPIFDWDFSEEYTHIEIPDPRAAMSEDHVNVPASYECLSRAATATACPMSIYSVHQIDPVGAKCAEIRSLLQGSDPLVTEDMITTNITRENLIYCIELFGNQFQRNFPILHSPTFTLVDTSPFLLLAMMLTGACYSNGLIPNAHITKISMLVLTLIERLPHERDMQIPSLSTIQASIIICGILVCSRNEMACRFVSVHFARNISMADRAGVFQNVPPLDYRMMTEDKFVWPLWIEQESRRRIACEILCQDMAACVFQGKSPSLSPLTLQVQLPCYESCWEARTSRECFQKLQQLPQQITISAASRLFRSHSISVDNTPLFEASTFGMFTLMMGLHGFLFQTLQEDIDPGLAATANSLSEHSIQNSSNVSDLLHHLEKDHSGASIAVLADSAVSEYGSLTIQRINRVLNAWHSTWQFSRVRDHEHEDITFKGDPMRFWWLAKLLLVAHVLGRAIHEDSELAILSPGTMDERGKIALQAKLIKWMSRFRRQDVDREIVAEDNILPSLMKPL